MKIVLAPDSFKESLKAVEVAIALEHGIRRVLPDVECIKVPMADGGEGTVDALVAATNGRRLRKTVIGPLGQSVQAVYGLSGDGQTAVIEMAAVSGLHLVPKTMRNPLRTSTFGTGQLIRAALAKGVRRIIVGLGGSATNDCGAGMAQALGFQLIGPDGRPLAPGVAGGDLSQVCAIDPSGRCDGLSSVEVLIACDVHNTVIGRVGAAAIYAPQKGATAAQVAELDRQVRHFCRLLKRDLGIAVLRLKGGGAAGGLGAGLVAFAGGQLRSGIELVIEAAALKRHLLNADLVITGEGRIDSQTAFGKAPAGVAAAAMQYGVPVIGVGGALAEDVRGVFAGGFDALESAITRDMSLEAALRDARRNLRDAGERIARWVVLGQKLANRAR